MTLITLTDLVKEFNGEPLFSPINLSLYNKTRLAIIGKNGCGKSTLLKMIIGELQPDKGQVILASNISIGYLSQSVISDFNHTLYKEIESTFSHIISMQEKIEELCKEIALHPEDKELLKKYEKISNDFEKLDGYNFRYKIDVMLSKFGFNKSQYDREISSFSGGEKMKIAFCKLLLQNPDLLILDEPTNHLDISTIKWLENYLTGYNGAILFVSHDQYFINAIADKVLEFSNKEVTLYNGNYDSYAAQKKMRYESLMKQYIKQEKERKKLEWFIKFYMPKPRFVSRAHDREKKLARLNANAIDKPKEEKNDVHMKFSGTLREGKRVFTLKNLVIGYDKPLLDSMNFTLYGGDKLAIMGDNGTGKTTFIKTLLRHIKPYSGEINFYEDYKIGYLKQDGLMLESELEVFTYFSNKFPNLTSQEIYNLLGAYSFDKDDFFKVISTLSGGEKMRLVLASLSAQKYDILILDEPTNHLDMFSKQELSSGLNKFGGSIIVISHDRGFIDSIATSVMYFYNKHCYIAEGNYSEFEERYLNDILAEKQEEITKDISKKDKITKEENIVKRRKPALSYARLLQRIEKIDNQISENKNKLNSPEYYNDQVKLNLLQEDIERQTNELNSLLEDLSYYED